ncbi:MAG: hypothetical protein IKE22_07030 [Atopobiaceae bacterium]|nr:hypothetical protein [Atopobiaceae bacterium]
MSSRKNQPAALTAAKQTSATSTSRDGTAAYLDDSATFGSPLWGFRQYCRTVAALRSSAKSVEEAAIRAVSRCYELAEAAEMDEQPRATWAVRRFDNSPSAMTFGRTHDTTLAADLDSLMTATAALASAVSDVCEIVQIGG